ncbi:PEP-CTERM sorting domain-containing protein [Roseateles sp.]|uniref:PEP-CTERM sorting domain-containing protein n=1 Tax=Roseateles sp. TaxID=1971397 RepID=UPI0025EFA88B|nr:PEP-CTERM sorting domain-containing protein [Roseateles sp.]MBV8036168.1 PEP-CTERM sorting domain-containing protein [Roseateles sp.]
MKTCIGAALLVAVASSQAAIVWDEAIQGDLSDNGLAPTVIAMAPGRNLVLGTMGDAGHGVDRDYFSFTVPAGHVLAELWLLPVTGVSGSASFFGIQAGPQLTVTPSGGGIEAFYGFNHYGGEQIGSDILVAMVGADKAPIPAGTWSVWLQETGGQVSYGLDFVITSAVPEPAAALCLGLGLLGLACRRSVLLRR